MFRKSLLPVLFIATLVFHGLAFGSQYINVYDTPKVLWLGILAVVLSVFLATRVEIYLGRMFGLFVIGFIFFVLFNLSFSINPSRSFFGDKVFIDSFLTFILYLCIAACLYFEVVPRKYAYWGFAILGFVLAVTGLLHAVGLYVFKLDLPSYDGRITGSIGQANMFGGILVTLLLFPVLLLKDYGRELGKVKKWFLRLDFLFIFICTLAAMSRGALVAMITATMVALFRRLPGYKFKTALVLLVLLLGLLVYFAPPLDQNYKTPYLYIRFLSFKAGGGINDIRFEIWKNSVAPIKEKYLTGWGNSTYQDVYQMYLNPDKSPQTTFSEVESSHNIIVDIALEWGIPALLVIISFFVVVLVRAKSSIYLKFAFLMLFLRSIINESNSTIWFLFFALSALLLADFDSSKRKLTIPVATVFKATILSLSILVFLTLVRMSGSEVYEKKALQEGDPQMAIVLFEQALLKNPHKQSLYSQYLSLLIWSGEGEKFLKASKVSEALFHDYRTYYYLGTFYMRSSDSKKAIEYFEKAYGVNKRDPKTTHYLGILYYGMKDYASAQKFFLRTVKLDAKNFSDDFVYLADIALKQGDRKSAQKYIEQAPDSVNKEKIDAILAK